jgi:hypothetical protein
MIERIAHDVGATGKADENQALVESLSLFLAERCYLVFPVSTDNVLQMRLVNPLRRNILFINLIVLVRFTTRFDPKSIGPTFPLKTHQSPSHSVQ